MGQLYRGTYSGEIARDALSNCFVDSWFDDCATMSRGAVAVGALRCVRENRLHDNRLRKNRLRKNRLRDS